MCNKSPKLATQEDDHMFISMDTISIGMRSFRKNSKVNSCGPRPRVDNIISIWRYVEIIDLQVVSVQCSKLSYTYEILGYRTKVVGLGYLMMDPCLSSRQVLVL